MFPRVGPRRLLTSRASNQQKIKHDTSLAGRACYYGGDPTAASLHFRAATQLDDAGLPAWEGVALTQVASGDYLGAAKTYEELVRVFFVGSLGRKREQGKKGASEREGGGIETNETKEPRTAPPLLFFFFLFPSPSPSLRPHPHPHPLTLQPPLQVNLAIEAGAIDKEREFLWREAETLDKASSSSALPLPVPTPAAKPLRALLAKRLSRSQRVDALCFLADIQAKEETARQEARVQELLAAADEADKRAGSGSGGGCGGGGRDSAASGGAEAAAGGGAAERRDHQQPPAADGPAPGPRPQESPPKAAPAPAAPCAPAPASSSSSSHVTRSVSRLRLQVDAERAEAEVSSEGGYGETLRAIVALTLPCPRYSRYHEAHLQRYLSALGAHPPRSTARADARQAALAECVRAVTTSAGGCCTPFPFEAAIWLLEEQEELCGGHVPVSSGSLLRLKTSLAGLACSTPSLLGGAASYGSSLALTGAGAGASPVVSPVAAAAAWQQQHHLRTLSSQGLHSSRRSSIEQLASSPRRPASADGAAAAKPRTPTGNANSNGPAAVPPPSVFQHSTVIPATHHALPSPHHQYHHEGPSLTTAAAPPPPSSSQTARAAAAALGRGAAAPVQLGWFRGNSIVVSSSERRLVGQLVPRAADRARADAAAVSAALAAQARREAVAKSRRQQRAREKEEQKARRGDAVADVSLASSEGDDDGEEEGDEAIEEEEEEEEEKTQQSASVIRIEQFGMKLAHQFPWAPSAAVAVGLALRRRFLSDPDAPSTVTRRRQITSTLRRGVLAGADSAAGWKALAELQYQNRDFAAAADTASRGLEWSVRRRAAGHETLTSFALSLRLCLARALRRLGRLDEAEAALRVLAGWVSEGECALDGLSGSPPVQIRQQALRGLAKIALARGDRAGCKATYERVLGKALIGRGAPAEHW